MLYPFGNHFNIIGLELVISGLKESISLCEEFRSPVLVNLPIIVEKPNESEDKSEQGSPTTPNKVKVEENKKEFLDVMKNSKIIRLV
jgi:hypothetical protein